MRKTLAALICYLLITFNGLAQFKIDDLSVSYGQDLSDDKEKIVKVVGQTSSKIYTVALKGNKNYFLKIFSATDMKLLSSNPIEMPEDGKELEFEDVVLLNNNLYLLASVYNKSEKLFTLDAIAFTENGVLKTKIIKLFESTVEKSSQRGSFYFKKNLRDDKLLVLHTALFSKEEALKFELKLFDENMKILAFKEDKAMYDDKKFKDYTFTISDFDIHNNDDFFMVINEGYRDRSKKEKIENFFLYSYKKSNSFNKEITKINVVDKEIINCTMLVTNQDEIKLTGFYSSVTESGKAERELKGLYNATVPLNTLVAKNVVFNEFDYDTKVKILGERRAKKGKDLNPLYEVLNIIEKSDGGLIVLSEFSTITVGRTTGFGPFASTPITYVKNEIIVNSLKKDGTLEWSNVVGKEQTAATSSVSFSLGNFFSATSSYSVAANLSVNLGTMGNGREFISAIPIYHNGELRILFNDSEKNKGVTNLDDIKSISNFKKSIPTIFHFDTKGNLKRKDSEDAIRNELIVRPGVFYRKSDKEFLLFISNQSINKLARLSIN